MFIGWESFLSFGIPTGDEKAFTGDGSFGGGVAISYEINLQFLQVLTNVGYIYSEGAEEGMHFDYRHKLTGILATFIPLPGSVGLGLNVSARGFVPLFSSGDQSPNAFYVGVRKTFKERFHASLGVHISSIDFENESSPYRISAGVHWLLQEDQLWQNY